MKKYLFLFMTLMVSNAINAIVVQRIYLKNGSVLNGYVERQDKKGNMTIRTESATICMSDVRLATKADSLKGYWYFNSKSNEKTTIVENELSDAWKEWAKQNDAYSGSEGNRTLELDVVQLDGKVARPVKLLESGLRVKYLEMNDNVYNVKWDYIDKIVGDNRKITELSGINRVYQTKDGTFEGAFAEETDNTLGLYINNMVQTFNINDVEKYTFKAVNPQQNIFEQTPFIETVCCEDGRQYSGIIIEQNYAKNSDNYLLIQDESGAIHSVKMSDYKEIKRSINLRYAPKFDVILKQNEVLVNRLETHKQAVKEMNDKLYLNSDSISKFTLIKNTVNKIEVEYRPSDYPNGEAFQFVKVNEEVQKKKNVAYFISYKDLASADCHPKEVEVNPNSVKATYHVLSAGTYTLYDSRKKEAIIIKVE